MRRQDYLLLRFTDLHKLYFFCPLNKFIRYFWSILVITGWPTVQARDQSTVQLMTWIKVQLISPPPHLCVVLVYLHESIFFKAKNCQCEIRIQKIFCSIVIESQRNKMFIETLLFWWMTCMRLDVELAIGLRYVVHCYHNLISNLIRETQWFIFVKFVYNHE